MCSALNFCTEEGTVVEIFLEGPSCHLSMPYFWSKVRAMLRRNSTVYIIAHLPENYGDIPLLASNCNPGHNRNMVYQDISIAQKPFVWRTLQEHNDTNNLITCRNSVQGKSIIVDDRGYVCRRKDLFKTGCCNTEAEDTTRYSCETCKDNNCCIIYEYCVSCCLDPSKRDMLELVLSKLSAEENVLFRSLTDDYELCLAKCRTSSHSVLHENSYRDPAHKHCFGDEPPGTRTPD
ncbi:unnamed protein product [Parnassius apollo]|uniref:SREBP regulating gene protein n=1 Tax=Parnassius apollo TaxID=110799 RepID=A0A8S3WK84_PARAO|nr:unnamed protein product [Parnassius apollo]